jgi:hypothetical protein
VWTGREADGIVRRALFTFAVTGMTKTGSIGADSGRNSSGRNGIPAGTGIFGMRTERWSSGVGNLDGEPLEIAEPAAGGGA